MTTNKPALKPLSAIEFIFYPLLRLFARGQAALLLKRRMAYRQYLIKKRNDLRKAKNELAKEAVALAEIIQHRWTALGEAWVPREYDPLAVLMPVRKRRKKRVQRVQFERIVTSAERIYLQIMVSKRSLFGYRTHLPYHVTVNRLTSEDVLTELSHATKRKCEASIDNYRSGAWIIVNRKDGVGGLPALVMFRDLLGFYPADTSYVPLLLGIGNPNRTFKLVELGKLPHVLIGGATGGGKSNLVNSLICQLMYFHHPDQLKFILIDLKDGMEFYAYKNSPHIKNLVLDSDQAIEALRELVKEIKRRNKILRGEAKELSIWNALHPDQAMPRLICIVDEYAQLTNSQDKRFREQVQDLVKEITGLGRACGVHMIISTQYPIVEVVPTIIKANSAIRIAFKMQNQTQSSVIINVGDAAFLPAEIKGRMLFVTEAVANEVQTPKVTEDDIKYTLRVASGRGAGLVSLQGIDPVIERESLLKYIVANLEGNLAISKLEASLREFAIDGTMVKAFVEDISQHKRIMIDGNSYHVTHKNGAYRLVLEISNDLPDEVLKALDITIIKEEPILPPAIVKEPLIIEQPPPAQQPAKTERKVIQYDPLVQEYLNNMRKRKVK